MLPTPLMLLFPGRRRQRLSLLSKLLARKLSGGWRRCSVLAGGQRKEPHVQCRCTTYGIQYTATVVLVVVQYVSKG